MLSVSAAFEKIMSFVPDVTSETVELSSSSGRILGEPVFADRDYPPINRSTMDGIAISSASWNSGVRSWTVERTIPAGAAGLVLSDPLRGCVQIMTGASVPDNGDGIIPFEQVAIDGLQARALPDAAFQPGQHIHKKSSDRRQGDKLLDGGIRIDSPRVAIMASVGHARVRVAVPPRVAVISTGNEIVPIDQASLAPTHVRASNLTGLEIALRQLGVTAITSRHLPDDLDIIQKEIASILSRHDILILSGGVSMGNFDYVPKALQQAGVEEIFHRVAQKPGKPLWFGQTASCRVFGLPGNPVSTLTVFRRYVAPYILASMGSRDTAPTTAQAAVTIVPHRSLTLFAPVKCRISENGIQQVEPVVYHGSGDFAALAESDGFAEIAPGTAEVITGTPLPFFRWIGC